MDQNGDIARLQSDFGLKRLTPGFAKFEIVFGLAGVWAGLWLLAMWPVEVGPLAASIALFVLRQLPGHGGLALAPVPSLPTSIRSATPADKT